MDPRDILLISLLAVGLFFNGLGVLGLLRFPDVYTRLHATTKATTFGSIFTSLTVVVYGLYNLSASADGQYLTLALHTLVAVFALAITNATGAHAIARAAHRSGVRPSPAVVDRLAEVKR
ncbi:MAG: monovalent cation/H(+) antiporter subunit G [Methanomicrobiales archaeon]|nr:monovalent cation/H(+) antiporter subunit G [Methanomicrobiales archaeon]MDI6877189.1 monovalent cation/H(+) antiporter subunit G [Methanomicrobiales archaeon]